MITFTSLIRFFALLSLFAIGVVNSYPIRGSKKIHDADDMSSRRRHLGMDMGSMSNENSSAPSSYYDSAVPSESPAPSGVPTVADSAVPSGGPSWTIDSAVPSLEPSKPKKAKAAAAEFDRPEDYGYSFEVMMPQPEDYGNGIEVIKPKGNKRA